MGIKGREVVREPLFLMESDYVCNVYIRPVVLTLTSDDLDFWC